MCTGTGISQLGIESGEAFGRFRNLDYLHAFFLFAERSPGLGFSDGIESEVAGVGIGACQRWTSAGLSWTLTTMEPFCIFQLKRGRGVLEMNA
jgi:hypothetical protein